VHIAFLVVLGVGSRIAAEQNSQAAGMLKISMTAFATSIHKPGIFQVGNQLADLAWHR
jgi:hypothetical protein